MAQATEADRRRRVSSTDIFCVVLLAAVVARFALSDVLSTPAVAAWATVFAAVCIQASPFLVLGIVLSTIFAAFLPPEFFRRVLPTRPDQAARQPLRLDRQPRRHQRRSVMVQVPRSSGSSTWVN